LHSYVQELVRSLMIGCSIIMLRSYGNMNIEYVAIVLYGNEISYLMTVAAVFWNHLLAFMQRISDCNLLTMRFLFNHGQYYIDWQRTWNFFSIFNWIRLSKSYPSSSRRCSEEVWYLKYIWHISNYSCFKEKILTSATNWLRNNIIIIINYSQDRLY
jgi:hypothetical protein